MTISKYSKKTKFALYAFVLGIGAHLAPAAADTTACFRGCGISKQACLRAAKANADPDVVADAIAACYSEWTECLIECQQAP